MLLHFLFLGLDYLGINYLDNIINDGIFSLGYNEYMRFEAFIRNLIESIPHDPYSGRFLTSYEEWLAGYTFNNLACVYILFNTLHRAAYVGSTSNLQNRLKKHFGSSYSRIPSVSNSSPLFQEAMIRDGKECFLIIVPEIVSYAKDLEYSELRRILNRKENNYLDTLYPTGRLYNISRKSHKRDVPAYRRSNRTLFNTRRIPRKR